METIFLLFFTVLFIFIFAKALSRKRTQSRQKLIDSYRFPERVSKKVQEQYPDLSSAEVAQVIRGLRDYFSVCNLAGKRMVSMPSQAVDVAWHEFILFTRQYEQFCKKALGRFLHHTPAEAMKGPTIAQQGIKTAWKISCFREHINPKTPTRLPFLFAIDKILKIPDGFHYSLNCQSRSGSAVGVGCGGYCASHIGCSSGCSGGCSGGFFDGDSDGDSGCGGGCGGGD